MNNAPDLRAPGVRNRGDGRLAGARERLGEWRERGSELAERKADSLATGLGWFSVGLGLAQMAMPERIAEVAGIEQTPETVRLMRSFGMRELTSGVGILTQPVPDKWLWGRVVGDVLDLAMLGVALANGRNQRGRTVGATLAVLGVTGLDLLAAREVGRRREAARLDDASIGEKTLFRIVTVKSHRANVESDWSDFVWSEGSDESREAVVTFAPAPGGRGTEIRAELTWTPKAGRIGETVQRMRHTSPGQMLGRDLRRFKMRCETGDIVSSDASIHEHMHPAQPDPGRSDGSERAGMRTPRAVRHDTTIQEEAR